MPWFLSFVQRPYRCRKGLACESHIPGALISRTWQENSVFWVASKILFSFQSSSLLSLKLVLSHERLRILGLIIVYTSVGGVPFSSLL